MTKLRNRPRPSSRKFRIKCSGLSPVKLLQNWWNPAAIQNCPTWGSQLGGGAIVRKQDVRKKRLQLKYHYLIER